MSIEAYHSQDQTQETTSANGGSIADRVSEETRAMLQTVVDMSASKSLLYPEPMRQLMDTLDTHEDGEPTTAGKVIALRRYAKGHLNNEPSTEPVEAEAPNNASQSTTNSRRATRATAPSPYVTGDGMIIPAAATKVERGGSVRAGTGAAGVSRRATRMATKLPKVDVNNYEPRGTSHRRDNIHDLVVLDKTGRARYESGVDATGRSLKGRFVTKHELETIDANQEQIRGGLAARNNTKASKNKKLKLERPANYPEADWKTRSRKDKKIIIMTEAARDDDVTQANVKQVPRKQEAISNLGRLVAAHAVSRLSGISESKLGKYYTDNERGKSRIAKTAVGGLALLGAGIIYAVSNRHGITVNGNRVQEVLQNKPHDVAGKKAALDEIHQATAAQLAAEKAHKAARHVTETLPTYNAHTGAGTVDHLVADQVHKLGYQISEHQQHLLTQHTLTANHLSWNDARHLPVGFHVNMLSPEEIEKVLKKRS